MPRELQALDVENDIPASARTRDAARTDLPRIHDIERRKISQIKMRNCGNSCSSVFAISKDRRIFELPQFVRTVQKHPYVGNI